MINARLEEPLIRIDSEVTRRVRQHARAHMQTEVCGVLVGKMCEGIIEIDAPIEAFTAAQAGAHVTFTQAAWETIYKVKDKDYPEDRIVGWYHSHPGFGVFLSDHDTFIHRNFFSSPDQIAWVYDPHSDEEGCFGWVGGSIHRIANISVADNSGEGQQRACKLAEASHRRPGAHTAQLPMETRPRLESQMLRNSLGFLSSFAVVLRKASVACLRLARSHILSIVPACRRLLRMQSVLAPSGRPGLEEAPQPPLDMQSGEAIEPLRPESGK
jgi:proteasome lid subunit RPN8/RPN11